MQLNAGAYRRSSPLSLRPRNLGNQLPVHLRWRNAGGQDIHARARICSTYAKDLNAWPYT
eukprot:4632900-Lingulodinium_polyedra.AAC.1